MRARAARLAAGGHVHWSVCHLLAVGDVWPAVQLYMRSGMPREALALARCRLDARDPAFSLCLLDQLLTSLRPLNVEALPQAQAPPPRASPAGAPPPRASPAGAPPPRASPAGAPPPPEAQEACLRLCLPVAPPEALETQREPLGPLPGSGCPSGAPLNDLGAVEADPASPAGKRLPPVPADPPPLPPQPSSSQQAPVPHAPQAMLPAAAAQSATTAPLPPAVARAATAARPVPAEALALQGLLAGRPLLAARALAAAGTAPALATAAQLCARVARAGGAGEARPELEALGRTCASEALQALLRDALLSLARPSGSGSGADAAASAAAASCDQVQAATAAWGGAELAGAHCASALLAWSVRSLLLLPPPSLLPSSQPQMSACRGAGEAGGGCLAAVRAERGGGGAGVDEGAGVGVGPGDGSAAETSALQASAPPQHGAAVSSATGGSALLETAAGAGRDAEDGDAYDEYDDDDELALQAVTAVYLGGRGLYRPAAGAAAQRGSGRRKVAATRRPRLEAASGQGAGAAGDVLATDGGSAAPGTTAAATAPAAAANAAPAGAVAADVAGMCGAAAASMWATACAACSVRPTDESVGRAAQVALQAVAAAAAAAQQGGSRPSSGGEAPARPAATQGGGEGAAGSSRLEEPPHGGRGADAGAQAGAVEAPAAGGSGQGPGDAGDAGPLLRGAVGGAGPLEGRSGASVGCGGDGVVQPMPGGEAVAGRRSLLRAPQRREDTRTDGGPKAAAAPQTGVRPEIAEAAADVAAAVCALAAAAARAASAPAPAAAGEAAAPSEVSCGGSGQRTAATAATAALEQAAEAVVAAARRFAGLLQMRPLVSKSPQFPSASVSICAAEAAASQGSKAAVASQRLLTYNRPHQHQHQHQQGGDAAAAADSTAAATATEPGSKVALSPADPASSLHTLFILQQQDAEAAAHRRHSNLGRPLAAEADVQEQAPCNLKPEGSDGGDAPAVAPPQVPHATEAELEVPAALSPAQGRWKGRPGSGGGSGRGRLCYDRLELLRVRRRVLALAPRGGLARALAAELRAPPGDLPIPCESEEQSGGSN